MVAAVFEMATSLAAAQNQGAVQANRAAVVASAKTAAGPNAPDSLPPGWSEAVFQLNDATAIHLRLLDNLTSGTEAVGQSVHFETVEEVRVSSVLVIPKGSPAWGVVIEAGRNRDQWHIGGLKIAFESVQLSSGEIAPLRTSGESSGSPAVELLSFAKQAPITRGAEVTAYVDGNFSLNARKFVILPAEQQVASAQPPTPPAATPSPAPRPVATRRQPKRPARHHSGN